MATKSSKHNNFHGTHTANEYKYVSMKEAVAFKMYTEKRVFMTKVPFSEAQ